MSRSIRTFQLYLSRAIRRQRLAHAIFFTDSDNENKTALANFFAMLLLCEHSTVVDETVTPCQSCSDCLQVSQQRHSNVEWIIPEQSNEIRIDQIREAREHFRLSSFNNKPRLIVLSNAGSLTTQAANALLKSVEEPNPHQYFLFMATSTTAIPQTLLSRCQKLIYKSHNHIIKPHCDSATELAQFASTMLGRICNGDITSRMGIIEEITKHPCDKAQLLFEIQKLLHESLHGYSDPSSKAHRDSLRRPLDATEQARAYLEHHANLQLTLENWLLNAWPIIKI